MGVNGHRLLVDITIEPLQDSAGSPRNLVVIFKDGPVLPVNKADPQESLLVRSEHVERLEMELRATRERLQATIEELESTNEELATSREELQSVNEELTTVNGELGRSSGRAALPSSAYGLAVTAAKAANPAVAVALTMVVSQGVMIAASLLTMRVAEQRGYWILLLISFLALPIRGVLASSFISQWGIYPVQLLDGIGAGIQSVAIPGLVARILDGTGRVNAGQGSIMTAQALGAALSPALGGWLAQEFGYPPMFVTLGSLALVSLILWVGNHAALEKSCKTFEAEKSQKKTCQAKRPRPQVRKPKAIGAG
jgi:hypothetical protein